MDIMVFSLCFMFMHAYILLRLFAAGSLKQLPTTRLKGIVKLSTPVEDEDDDDDDNETLLIFLPNSLAPDYKSVNSSLEYSLDNINYKRHYYRRYLLNRACYNYRFRVAMMSSTDKHYRLLYDDSFTAGTPLTMHSQNVHKGPRATSFKTKFKTTLVRIRTIKNCET
ncbi:hypothetical protein GQX74_011469 [Glossina fuscipes]|nr:hypothetical protein GQX74_011469 [Glossina fuscipes]